MPRPKNPLDLVYNPLGRFPADPDWLAEWRHLMRSRQYFRVVGYNEMRAKFGIHNNSDIENNLVCDKAKKIVEDEWAAFLPPTSPNQDSISRVGKSQIERVRKRQVVSFQSACIAVVALEIALHNRGATVDIYPSGRGRSEATEAAVRICPALYEVEGYDLQFHETEFPSVRAGCIKATYQVIKIGEHKTSVFEDIAAGRLVTEPLAQNLTTFWDGRLGGPRLCQPRSGRVYRKVSEVEVTVWPL